MTLKSFVTCFAGLLGLICAAIAPVEAQGSLNIICAPAAPWCEAIVAGFTKETGIKVNMVRKSSGEILAQVRAEAQNPKLDLWFGASTDTHFVALEGGLLQPYTSPNMAAWARLPSMSWA